jgi:hypothetical protein
MKSTTIREALARAWTDVTREQGFPREVKCKGERRHARQDRSHVVGQMWGLGVRLRGLKEHPAVGLNLVMARKNHHRSLPSKSPPPPAPRAPPEPQSIPSDVASHDFSIHARADGRGASHLLLLLPRGACQGRGCQHRVDRCVTDGQGHALL